MNLVFVIFLNVTCEKYEINLCEQNRDGTANKRQKNPK